MSEQLDLLEGIRRRNEGRDAVEEKGFDFVETMRDYAVALSRRCGPITIDDVRAYAEEIGMEPHHPNAWGAIFKGKDWVHVGWEKSKVISNHARVVRVWRLAE